MSWQSRKIVPILLLTALPIFGQELKIKVGDTAPDFTLKAIGLQDMSLHDYRGKNVVLLFYPLDWTPG